MSSIAVLLFITIATNTQAVPETCSQDDSCQAPSTYGTKAEGVSLLQYAQYRTAQSPAAVAAEDAAKKAPADAAKKEGTAAASNNASAPAAGKEAAKEPAKADAKAAPEEAANEASVNASVNATANSSENVTNATTPAPPVGCATKNDPRASAWFAETAPEGTPCVFAADPRDEGSHCIFSDGVYGSNGWCYTNLDLSSWGSCNNLCPLYGATAKLGSKIDTVAKAVHEVQDMVNGTGTSATPPSDANTEGADAPATANTTSADTAPAKEANKSSAFSQMTVALHDKVYQDPTTPPPAADAATPAPDAATTPPPAGDTAAATTGAPPAGEAAPEANASAAENATNATGNATNTTAAGEGATLCETKEDSRIAAWFTETAAPGTPCVFGVDARDEGSHCIFSGGEFGSNGWCFTSKEGSAWGSCNEHCPLYGEHAKLASKIDKVSDMVGSVNTQMEAKLGGDAPADEASATTPPPADAAPAADAKTAPAADANKTDAKKSAL